MHLISLNYCVIPLRVPVHSINIHERDSRYRIASKFYASSLAMPAFLPEQNPLSPCPQCGQIAHFMVAEAAEIVNKLLKGSLFFIFDDV